MTKFDATSYTNPIAKIHVTPVSLLYRLRDPQHTTAWESFVELYTPLLFTWSKQLGHQDSDCADLVQDVFLILWQKLPEFEYDASRSFHAWLKTVFLNRYRSGLRVKAVPAFDNASELCVDALEQQIVEEDEMRYLVRQAFRLIEQEYSELHQRVFRAYVMEDRPPEEVAAEFGVRLGTIYGIKSKILSHLRQKLERILD